MLLRMMNHIIINNYYIKCQCTLLCTQLQVINANFKCAYVFMY